MRETEILRGLGKARMQHTAPGYSHGMVSKGLRRGVAKLNGPGTTTSDSIPANLSKGEAVLPAKTVQAVGEHNLRRLITSTNGAPPASGLRAGAGYNEGVIPPEADVMGAKAQDLNRPTGAGPTYRAGTGAERIATAADEAAAAARQAATSGGLGGSTASTATQAPKPEGLKAKAAQAYSDLKGGLNGAASNAAESGVTTLKKVGKVLLGVAGTGVETMNVAKDITTPGMSRSDQFDRVGETLNRSALGYAGVKLGAKVPGPWFVKGASALGLGAAGYMAPGLFSKLTGGTLPSEKAAGLRAASEKAGAVAPNPNSPYGDGPDQTANTRFRTNFTPNDRAHYIQTNDAEVDGDPKLWSGRGLSVPANTPAAALQPANVDPRSRDFTAELNAAPANLPAGLREGVIYKTVDPKTGRVAYSGKNVGYDPNTPTQFVDGTGRTLPTRGGLQVVSGNSPVELGPNGSFVASPAGSAPSPEFMAAKQRALNPEPSEQGGLSAGQKAQSPQDSTERRLNAALADGTLTRAGATLLQALVQNRTTAQGQQLQHQASMQGHDVAREGHHLTSQANTNRLLAEAGWKGVEMRQKGSDMLEKALTADPNATLPNADGKIDPAAKSEFANFVRQKNLKVNGRQLSEAFATHPDDAGQALSSLSGEFALRKLIDKQGGNTLFTNTPQAGDLKVVGVGPAAWSDYVNGQTVKNIAWDKVFGGGQVKVAGPNNTIAQISLRDIRNHANAANMLQALSESIARQNQPAK